jgi:hypothetical protein
MHPSATRVEIRCPQDKRSQADSTLDSARPAISEVKLHRELNEPGIVRGLRETEGAIGI